MQLGETKVWERTFTREDVAEFGRLSGDNGAHHVIPDEHGRVMVQGLLVATLPTKIGGDLNFIARTTEFTFLRPVFTGDCIRCEVTLAEVVEQEDRFIAKTTIQCLNQHNKITLEGVIRGIMRK